VAAARFTLTLKQQQKKGFIFALRMVNKKASLRCPLFKKTEKSPDHATAGSGQRSRQRRRQYA